MVKDRKAWQERVNGLCSIVDKRLMKKCCLCQNNDRKLFATKKKKKPLSSIVDYLIMTGHMVHRLTSLNIIYTHKNPCFLKFVAAAAIGLERTLLFQQKELITQLKLHWGTKSMSHEIVKT